ncbi:hypothetical protein M446_2977 [Methylobacterium sp. 4-46]|uniref:hypothetical protein n=1 Tax=unclassified Methylobacterium TaxID=2615210 RepID=UPI000152DE07|nr:MULTISPECIES: hypothetical protein [Methylobacterium]ACA17389.1 hypothetical protein M446_2977 [Methylobacterium sp. 4-46]WFT83076.1 DUF2441 domain-containing protein [Methylobacterium nodulans]
MTRLFHAADHYPPVGAILRPGHYGRMIGVSLHCHYDHAREKILEEVRAAGFRDKPSRLRSIFACLTEEDVRAYVETQCARHAGRVREPLYEVESIDAAAPTHVGDWTIAEAVRCGGDEAVLLAELYWKGSEGPERPPVGTYRELVTTSPLRVVRRLDAA